ncbi:MAG TPA: pyridoxamine 5'-phosphate oxidase family protein [Bacteroidetes bacterium]|nr:pyridoxamine 5'-phosphate oxidase family protein [Bacteroidota bacterium]
MKFNKITRGAKRAVNDEAHVYAILDAGFLCHVAFVHEGVPMIIPTAYGRKGDIIYLHGSVKNFMLNQIIQQQTISISVTHLDGIVLARTLFDTSANYRSVVLFGKATLLEKEEDRLEALKIITDNIIPGRWEEVPVGSDSELKATMVVAFKIEHASAKVRSGGPAGDENQENEVWSGHIPLELKAHEPIADPKFGDTIPLTKSVKDFWRNRKD